MRLVEGFALRKVLDEWIAVPGGESAARFTGLFSMNETGAFLFSLLQEEQSEASLLQALLENYDTDEEAARGDMLSFLHYLRTHNLLADDAT